MGQKKPVLAPLATRMELINELVVVLPFVPVTPTSFSACAGFPKKLAAVMASAFRGSLTWTQSTLLGQSADKELALTTATAPRATASCAKRFPSVATPCIAT